MMATPTFSVLTPTFNRAHTLHRVYESLKQQTMCNFEWIVIDDGSTDGTQDLLARWQIDAEFPIMWCHYGNNRGRNAAVNTGMGLVSGEYTLILDSDDALFDDAIETIDHWVKKTKVDKIETVYALLFRCVDQNGKLVGEKMPKKTLDLFSFSDNFLLITRNEGRYRLGLQFEVLTVQKTRILQEFAFKELTDREHCPEAITQSRICSSYDSIYVNLPLRKYWRFDGNCLSDGPSSGIKWPRGNYLWALSTLNEDIEHFRYNRKEFFNKARKITRLGLHIGRPLTKQYRDLNNYTARLLWILVMYRALLGYARDCLRGTTIPKAHPNISAWGPADPPEHLELHSASKKKLQT